MQEIAHTSLKDASSLLLDEVKRLDSQMDYSWNSRDWNSSSLNQYEVIYLIINQYPLKLGGFILLSFIEGNDFVDLLKIVVNKEDRGSQMAAELMIFLKDNLRIRGIKKIILEVSKENKRAISFYKKHQFKLECEMKKFYSDGGDALKMLSNL